MPQRSAPRRRFRALGAHLGPHPSAATPQAESGVHNPLLPTEKRSESAVAPDGTRIAYDVITPEGGPTQPETIVLLHGAGVRLCTSAGTPTRRRTDAPLPVYPPPRAPPRLRADACPRLTPQGSAAVWYKNAGHFARCGHRTIQWDSRCFGRSTGTVAEDFRVEALPEDLAAVLDAEGIESAVLVCQSMGGWTGLPFACTFPDRVLGLVLSGTRGGLEGHRGPLPVPAVSPIPELGGGPLAKEFVRDHADQAAAYFGIGALNGFSPDESQLIFDRLFDLDNPNVREEELAAITAPVLILVGESDPVSLPLCASPVIIAQVCGHALRIVMPPQPARVCLCDRSTGLLTRRAAAVSELPARGDAGVRGADARSGPEDSAGLRPQPLLRGGASVQLLSHGFHLEAGGAGARAKSRTRGFIRDWCVLTRRAGSGIHCIFTASSLRRCPSRPGGCHAARANMLATSSFVELKVARAEGVESRPCARAVIRFCQATEADGGTVACSTCSPAPACCLSTRRAADACGSPLDGRSTDVAVLSVRLRLAHHGCCSSRAQSPDDQPTASPCIEPSKKPPAKQTSAAPKTWSTLRRRGACAQPQQAFASASASTSSLLLETVRDESDFGAAPPPVWGPAPGSAGP